MAIQFHCVCGSLLKATEEYAGATCICPYCQRIAQVPSLPGRDAPSPGAAPSKTPSSDSEAIVDATVIDEPLDVAEFFSPPLSPVKPEDWGTPADWGIASATSATSGSAGGSAGGSGGRPPAAGGGPPPGAPPLPPLPPRGGAAAGPAPPPRPHWSRRMLIALLDPHAIQWFLMLGGGLMVLGLVIWLASLGIFKNPYVVAACLGAGSLATLGAGCGLALRTRFVTAGKALSFLGCVVLPLNLWYYEHQGILTVDGQLWMAAFVICWLYVATVYLLRDALFMYAVEAGVTLTSLLLMASLGRLSDVTYLSLTLVVLALVSVHAERAFAPDSVAFPRRRFGLALFWSGQAQLAAGLLFLLAAQIMREFVQPTGTWLGIQWTGVPLTDWRWLAAGVWVAGAYAWLYSDLVVRRVGVYTYLAGACLMLAGVTLVGLDVATETLILILTAAAVTATLLGMCLPATDDRYRRTLAPTSLILCFLAVGLGALAHLRATSLTLAEMRWAHDTGWYFVAVMAVAAAANRLLTSLQRERGRQTVAAHLFLSAAALLIGAAGLLRQLELRGWHQQAPLLMIIPMIYLLVSRLRVERDVRVPLQWIAHVATAAIMLSIFVGSFSRVGRVLLPVSGQTENLLAGLVFAEATLFYALAAWIRRQETNYYLATVAGCAAAWEWLGYAQVPSAYYTLLYAALGVALLCVSRVIGIRNTVVYDPAGRPSTRALGPGRPLYLIANGLVAMAVVAAILQAVARLIGQESNWQHLVALLFTTAAGGLATVLSRRGAERWWHATGTTILAGLTFLTFNVLVDLPLWRKVEVFAIGSGLALLVASYIGRFREDQPNELVSVGLWLGSLLASLAALATVFYQGIMVSPADDMALLTITILMVASGAGLQFKAPTMLGGTSLGVYLAAVIVNLAYSPQVAVGVYLAVGGLVLFLLGLALSMYRERLLELPEKLARREGVFKIIGWR
ncbi:MAG: hypothetical protein U0935_06785 [Pirellulales bacterium]